MTEQDTNGDYEIINGMKIPLRDNQRKPAPKRFYKHVYVEQADAGFCVKLDQRILKSPEGVVMNWPVRPLAQRVAEEWDFQEKRIILHHMPLTTLSYSSLGRPQKIFQDLRKEMLSYGSSDLIVYRSANPQELLQQQKQGWDPVLLWLETAFNASFDTVEGISFITQPQKSLDAIQAYLAKVDDEHLPALMLMTKLSGSLFLSMAVRENYLQVPEAWSLAMIDEDWQNSQWGRDDAQKKKLLVMNRDFSAAADFIKLFQPQKTKTDILR